jgi:hypothetical protein
MPIDVEQLQHHGTALAAHRAPVAQPGEDR